MGSMAALVSEFSSMTDVEQLIFGLECAVFVLWLLLELRHVDGDLGDHGPMPVRLRYAFMWALLLMSGFIDYLLARRGIYPMQ